MDQQKQTNQIKMQTTKEYGETRCVICQNGKTSCQQILWTKEFPHKDAPASSSRESASEPLRKVVSGKHSIYTYFQRDRDFDICMKTKMTGTLSRKRTGTAIF